MEEELEKPKVIEDPKIQNIKRVKRFLIVSAIILAASIIFTGIFYFLNQKTIPLQLPGITQPTKPSPTAQIPGSIAKVGEEYLYQTDFNAEMNLYPSTGGTDSKQFILERLITDSIILQGAQSDGIIKLDSPVFNSKNKDYKKRVELTAKVKNDIKNQSDTYKGTIVTIWFLNDHVGPLGYEKAKQIALEKITKLHNDVKSGKITIEQAGEAIKRDSSLAQLDKAYKSNALFSFYSTKDDPPTYDDDFNQALFNLPAKSTSEVFTGKSADLDNNNQLTDAYFTFGQLKEKAGSGKYISIDDWLNKKKGIYSVEIY